jgi:hypothetical protein
MRTFGARDGRRRHPWLLWDALSSISSGVCAVVLVVVGFFFALLLVALDK